MTRPGIDGPPRDYAIDQPRALPGEIQFLLIVLALALVFLLVGLPGESERVAGDGSDALRQGWAERHQAGRP